MTIGQANLDPKVVFRLLEDTSTFATILHIILLQRYGKDIYSEDPLELFLRLKDDYGVTIPEDNESKINAILLVTSTDIFYEEPEAFRAICNTLTEGDPGIDMLDDLTVAELFWGTYEVELNHGPGEFQPAVSARIEFELTQESADFDSGDTPASIVTGYAQAQWQDLADQLALLGIPASQLPPVMGESPAFNQLEAAVAEVLQ